jgi:hypothetical protein
MFNEECRILIWRTSPHKYVFKEHYEFLFFEEGATEDEAIEAINRLTGGPGHTP